MDSVLRLWGPILWTLVISFTWQSSAYGKNACFELFSQAGLGISELGPVREFDFTKQRFFKELRKEYPELKPVAEYEQTGTLILHTSSLVLDGYRYYSSLLSHLPPDVRTLMVGTAADYDGFVRFQFGGQARQSESGPLDTFLKVQNETTPLGDRYPIERWVQDHMGQMVSYKGWDGLPVNALVTANYRFDYKISEQISRYLGVQIIKNINSQHEWGNFTVIGDTGYIIYGSRTNSNLKIEDFAHTGISRLVVLPQPMLQGKKLGIPHTDEFLIPLSRDHVLTNVKEYAEYFKAQGKKAELLPNNADLMLDHLTYTNAVLVNGKDKRLLFVPQFGSLKADHTLFGEKLGAKAVLTLKRRDKEALKIYQAMAKELGITVVPVDAALFTLTNFGGLHCATGICASIPNADKEPSWYGSGDSPL